jgi:PAS domain S-box-containing protein
MVSKTARGAGVACEETVREYPLAKAVHRQFASVRSARVVPSGPRTSENKLRPQHNPMLECGYSPEFLIDVAPVMIWSSDADKLCCYFNRPWLTHRGRSIEDEIGTGWFDGVHSDDRERRRAVYDDASFQLRTFQVEYRLERHDGAYRWIMESAVPRFSSNGKFLGYVGSCVDIHERKLAEQPAIEVEAALRRENLELRELAYAAAHDLQEPLRTVVIYTELIARRFTNTCCDAAADECFGFVQAGVERMQALVRGLLHYSSVSRSSVPAAVVVDLNSVFDQAVCVCQGAMAQSGAQITREKLPQIRADEKQLVSLLQNLFSNAIKYRRPEVQPRIHVSATAERDRWVFEVSDNGMGFDPQYAERIFQAFQRLHSHRTYSGTGLGLAICKKIVECHGGCIWATSQPGQGSQFHFTLAK